MVLAFSNKTQHPWQLPSPLRIGRKDQQRCYNDLGKEASHSLEKLAVRTMKCLPGNLEPRLGLSLCWSPSLWAFEWTLFWYISLEQWVIASGLARSDPPRLALAFLVHSPQPGCFLSSSECELVSAESRARRLAWLMVVSQKRHIKHIGQLAQSDVDAMHIIPALTHRLVTILYVYLALGGIQRSEKNQTKPITAQYFKTSSLTYNELQCVWSGSSVRLKWTYTWYKSSHSVCRIWA